MHYIQAFLLLTFLFLEKKQKKDSKKTGVKKVFCGKLYDNADSKFLNR